ncbi:MAG: MmgE/PrpD family protein [Salinirussus sp.]
MIDPHTGNRPAESLGTFLSELSLDAVPEPGIDQAERCFLDTVGVAVAGSTAEAGTIAAETMAELQGTDGPATLVGRGTDASVLDAVFVNAAAGHSLDFDDTVSSIHTHVSLPLVAAILAAGEATGASGEDAIEAYIAGYETDVYVARPFVETHYELGWHATSTFGVFGTAAAAATLWDLSADETATALEMAASFASGLKKNFGSTTKPIHPAHAARSGLTAAALARHGATATAGALGAERGFYDLYGEGADPDPDAFPDLGERWAIVEDGVDVKKYPCCHFTHTAIAATEALQAEHGFSAADVESVAVEGSSVARETVAHDDPSSGLQGKFSMPYCVASAIHRDRVGIDAFADEAVAHPEVRALLERVTYSVDESLAPGAHGATVRITLRDGETIEQFREQPPGTHENPLSEAELLEKFRHCATRIYDDETVDTFADRLRNLRDQEKLARAIPGGHA